MPKFILSPRYVVRSLTLQADGSVAIEYTDVQTDMRANGLVQNHVIFVPAGADYDQELEDLDSAVQALLADVLEDLTLVPSVDPRVAVAAQAADDDDEDDEPTPVERNTP